MILQRYLVRRLLVAAAASVLGLTVPVILISLFNHLPRSAVFSDLVWPALFGIAPMIFYLSLPVAVAVAIVAAYGHFASNGELTSMRASGVSDASIRMPAIVVAMLATVIGYVTSSVIAPHGSRHLQDVLHVIERDLSPALLEPNRFYYLSGGRRVFQFQERGSRNWISGVFLTEVEADEQRTYFARDALFESRQDESWIILRNGLMQVQAAAEPEKTITFEHVARPTGLAGATLPRRSWTGAFELTALQFFARGDFPPNTAERRQWVSEAVKRVAIPPLALVHSALGLALIALWNGAGRYRRWSTSLVCGAIFAIHMPIIIAADYTAVAGTHWAWVAAAIIAAEIALLAGLMLWQGRHVPALRVSYDTKLLGERLRSSLLRAGRYGSDWRRPSLGLEPSCTDR